MQLRTTQPAAARPLHQALALVLCVGGLLLRLWAVPPEVGDIDSVNLARGLAHFDVFAQAPHFPGYPVLIAAGTLLRELGVERPVWALSLPGILLFPVAGWLLFSTLRWRLSPAAALGALAVAALSPACVLAGGWPASDGLGLSLLMLGWGLLLHRASGRAALGWLLLGLLLGVRLSWWPLVAASAALWLLVRRPLAPAFALGSAGIALWLVPMLARFGAGPLFELATGFTEGHVYEFGGSALAAGASAPGARLLRLLWGLWDGGFGGLWPAEIPQGAGALGEHGLIALPISALCLAALWRMLRTGGLGAWSAADGKRFAFGVLLFAPYLLWLLGFQNVQKLRHLTPLLLPIGALLSMALSTSGHRARWSALLLPLSLLAVALPRALEQGQRSAPGLALMQYVQAQRAPDRLLIFAGPEARLFEHLAPSYRVLRAVDGEIVEREARRAAAQGVEVWLSSSAPGFVELSTELTWLAEFTATPSVRPHESGVALARFVPQQPTLVSRVEALP
ncbi:MAG: hypothetical protein OEZ06_08435 [Myxococcales bacterium]|nr:hypothetical protein [Myxococcales bacterium]